MTHLVWNLALAAVWAAALGDFSLPNLAAGFVLGFGVLWLVRDGRQGRRQARKGLRVLELAALFLWELLLSSLRVAWDVVTPRHRARPAVIALPLDVTSDGAITLLASLISLTPGSLSLDLSEDRRTLFVHVMFLGDEETVKRDLKDTFERRIREIFR